MLPALAERLDQAFPESGWRRDARGWVATNEEHTHSRLSVRAERVVAHGPAPRGFLKHGGEATLWTAYVNGGAVPRGADFVRAVRELADCAGVDSSPLERSEPPDRKAQLLHEVDALCRRELASDRGWRARDNPQSRWIPAASIENSGLGLFPAGDHVASVLSRAGYSEPELAASEVLADSRWPGRLVGAWRDERGRVRTFWARSLAETGNADTRYLYLRGSRRAELPPYGLSDVLAGPVETRCDVVLVEGVFDLHQLRAHGLETAGALGGTGVRPDCSSDSPPSASAQSRCVSTTTTPDGQRRRVPSRRASERRRVQGYSSSIQRGSGQRRIPMPTCSHVASQPGGRFSKSESAPSDGGVRTPRQRERGQPSTGPARGAS